MYKSKKREKARNLVGKINSKEAVLCDRRQYNLMIFPFIKTKMVRFTVINLRNIFGRM